MVDMVSSDLKKPGQGIRGKEMRKDEEVREGKVRGEVREGSTKTTTIYEPLQKVHVQRRVKQQPG